MYCRGAHSAESHDARRGSGQSRDKNEGALLQKSQDLKPEEYEKRKTSATPAVCDKPMMEGVSVTVKVKRDSRSCLKSR